MAFECESSGRLDVQREIHKTKFIRNAELNIKKEGGEFHVLTLGYGLRLVDHLWAPLEEATGFSVSHLLHPSLHQKDLSERESHLHLYCIRNEPEETMPLPDTEYLASLEGDNVPTIHNMIMCDSVLRELPYSEAIAYASYVGRRMENLFKDLKPSVIISGFDGFQSSMSLAVAKKLSVPWFALSFSVMPRGLTGFASGMNTSSTFSALSGSQCAIRTLAERTLLEFEAGRLLAPSIKTENNIKTIINLLPTRILNLFSALKENITGQSDKFSRRPVSRSVTDYFRRRLNLIRLPRQSLLKTPPDTPYLFIGLHMQPEMAIDVWAPFYADQFNVIEAIARSSPPTHRLLVKLHKIDADNYSPMQLHQLARLPGVELVSPFASSRQFIEKASLILSIQGTITLEAALLGRPVLVFGETVYTDLPSVTKVGRITDLPEQIRSKLAEEPLARESIMLGLESVLRRYAPGCFNDWDVLPTASEIEALAIHFEALQCYLAKAISA